jgi:hypothetical protein
VTRETYKWVADVHVDLGAVPPVPARPEFLLALLTLVVDAGDCVTRAVDGTEQRGAIHVQTRLDDGRDEIVVSVACTDERGDALATRCLRRRAR